MYVFTVSGLNLFGGALTRPQTLVDPTTLEAYPNPNWDCTNIYGNFYFENYTHCPPR